MAPSLVVALSLSHAVFVSIRAVGDYIVMNHEVSYKMMMSQPLYKLNHQKYLAVASTELRGLVAIVGS